MDTYHEVKDEAKVQALMASMERDGWQGAPLVAEGDQLYTGVHRYTAAQRLGWADYQIPTVDVREIWEALGRDFEAEVAEVIDDYADGSVCIAEMLGNLPQETKDYYGIDCY